MKIFLIGLVVVILLAGIGYGGWYYFIKKSPEGGKCAADARCDVGKCINKACSSGKIESACKTYNDCESGLLCLKSQCAKKPDFSQYFDKVTISKMKPGSGGPGPNNIPTETSIFTTSDAFEIDFSGVKSITVGPYYFEFVNTTTGEVVRSTKGTMDTNFAGQDIGSGTDLSDLKPGQYDVNVYFKDKIIYSATFTVQ